MKSFIKTATLSFFTVSSLSLIISSSFFIYPNSAEASGHWDDIGRIAGKLISNLRIPLPKLPGNSQQPYTLQTTYQLTDGSIVKVCEDIYPGNRASQKYWCN